MGYLPHSKIGTIFIPAYNIPTALKKELMLYIEMITVVVSFVKQFHPVPFDESNHLRSLLKIRESDFSEEFQPETEDPPSGGRLELWHYQDDSHASNESYANHLRHVEHRIPAHT